MGNSVKKSDFSAPDYIDMDQSHTTARYYNSYMALIKLRQNYSTQLSKIPKGAFRCILEY